MGPSLEPLQALANLTCRGGVGRRHKDRVVSGNRTDNVRPIRIVQALGDGVGTSGRCAQHNEVLGRARLHDKLRNYARQGALPQHCRCRAIQHVVAFSRLHDPQIAQVARQRSLADVDAFSIQRGGQLLVRAD